MTDTKQVAKIIEKAWDEKDEATMRKHLHPDYVCHDPMTTTKGIDKSIEKMKAFPFEGYLETKSSISEGDIHAHDGVWHVTSPFKADIAYASLMKFEGGKLKEKTIYFDTAKLPK